MDSVLYRNVSVFTCVSLDEFLLQQEKICSRPIQSDNQMQIWNMYQRHLLTSQSDAWKYFVRSRK
jgi:hypothetical protein